jgi:hypothetical protein
MESWRDPVVVWLWRGRGGTTPAGAQCVTADRFDAGVGHLVSQARNASAFGK